MSIPHDHEFQIGDEFTDGTKVIGVHGDFLVLRVGEGRPFVQGSRMTRRCYTLKPPAPTAVDKWVVVRHDRGHLYMGGDPHGKTAGTLTSWSDGTVTWEAAE